MSSPQIYLILGPASAGRRAVLVDLMTNGLDETAQPLLLVAVGELTAPDEVESRLAAIGTLTRGTWTIDEGLFTAEVPDGATHVFVLSDGRANPVDQIEAFHAWLPLAGGDLARVITIIDCQLGATHHLLMRWYDACVHFSDVVLLSNRDGVPNKWISDFVARYRKQHFPCLIEYVKHGEVANPVLVLEPEARRMSLLFDETDAIEVTITGDDDDEDDDDDEVVDEDAVPVDRYIERQAGSGRREKEIPDIAKFLPSEPGTGNSGAATPTDQTNGAGPATDPASS